MDGNKDEALRCIQIAKGAISAGDKSRALKFIKIAQRLHVNLAVDDLLAACENLDTEDYDPHKEGSSKRRDFDLNGSRSGEKDDVFAGMPNGSRDYSEENVQLIRKIKKSKDYYAILGVKKTCTVEEIRKAYRKLSLKVHPDKNKAPGSDDAFKIVSKAFKCLSDDDSRRQYDHTGLIEDFEVTQQYGARRRRRTRDDFGDDNFDPDEIFRSFFYGSSDMFNNKHVYRTRTRAREPARETETTGSNFNVLVLLQILPIFVILLMAYLPFSEPEFALQKTQTHRVAKLTEQYGVEYYVKHPDFDQNFPLGSAGRSRIENNIVREYKNLLGRYCHMEMQRHQWNRNYPTPHCDKLHSFGVN